VQRWEKREQMPVHRHLHDKRGSVYAFPAELDAWWQGRRKQLERDRTVAVEMIPAPDAAASAATAPPIEPRTSRRGTWIGAAAILLLIPVGFLCWKWLGAGAASISPPSPTIARLTSTSGLNVDPAVSADGSLIAYASDRGGSGGLDIWVQPTGLERPVRVTSEPGDELEPSFSPADGSIVFSKGEVGLYVVESPGGAPRLLVSAARARNPRFSPDGQWVTYWAGLPVWAVAPGAIGALFVVPARGGAPRPLAADFAHARYGAWSADGQKILFVGERSRDPEESTLDWYIVGVDGTEPVRTGAVEVLRRAGVKGLPIPGGWSADGAVTFATYDDGASNVWQAAISPSTGRVAGDVVRLTLGTAIERSPAVSSGSGRIMFSSVAENVDVWRLPLDAKTGLANGAVQRVTDNAAGDRLLNTSRDGQTMAFLSSRTGHEEIWVREVNTGRDRQITSSNARWGRLNHDGSIVAVATEASGTAGVDLVPIAGGARSVFCDDCYPGDWSPDGTRLVIQRGTPRRLFVREVGSGREVELAGHPTWNLYQPRFSPDGRWIVFHTSNSPSLRQIYAVPAIPEAPVPVDAWIPIVGDFGLQPSWAADGSGIYHFSLRDGAFCAWLQPLDPKSARPVGGPRVVQHFHEPRLRAVAGARVSNHVAAGYLYVTLTESAANIWMLEPSSRPARR
jgi:Tol biopolymer transport system component